MFVQRIFLGKKFAVDSKPRMFSPSKVLPYTVISQLEENSGNLKFSAFPNILVKEFRVDLKTPIGLAMPHHAMLDRCHKVNIKMGLDWDKIP